MGIDDIFLRLGLAIAIGLLVGLQRQSEGNRLAGIRTFPIFCVLGYLCGLLAPEYGGWTVAAGAVALAGLMVAGLYRLTNDGSERPGMTTLAAGLLLYMVGAWLTKGSIALAVAVGGGTAVLLQSKTTLHTLVGRLGGEDLRAVFLFVLLALVILPVLPHQGFSFGLPIEVINPREVWLLVVLIVGVGLVGYFLLKFLGERAGTVLGGMLGGLVSSTATTVSFARRSRGEPSLSRQSAVVVQLATTMSMLRLTVLVCALAPVAVLGQVVAPMLILAAGMAVITLAAWRWLRSTDERHVAEQGNPAELLPALVFAGLYAVISFATAAGNHWLGQHALYAVAAISGTTDLDAITLSSVQLAEKAAITPSFAWRLIVVGTIANLAFKTGIAYTMGSRDMARRTAVLYGTSALVGVGILIFW